MKELDVTKIREFYDSDPQKEWDRHDRYPFEFPITCKHIERYLPGDKFNVLDVGGGPGRYSLYLANLGHAVTLFDLSSGNIEFARNKSAELRIPLSDCIVGNAIDLGQFSEDKFDLVLNLGPLYHIDNLEERVRCIAESIRVLKKGGVAFFAFISRYAPIYDTLKKIPEREIMTVGRLRELFELEKLIHSDQDPGFTDAKFVDPIEVGNWVRSLGNEVISIFGAESLLPQSQYRIESLGKMKQAEWTNFGFEMSETTGGIVGSEHIVVVVKKSGT